MSEAITKACNAYRCDGGICKYTEMPWATCSKCKGTGRVPDVKATLRAEVARLTEQNAYLASERERLIPLAVQAQKNAPPPVFVLPPGVDGDIVALRVENTRLTAEVEWLTNQNGALMAQAQEDIRVLGYAVDKNLALSIENERLTAEVERLSQREPTQQECDEAEGKPDATGKTWSAGEVFLGQTCRRCIDCGRWTFGGPTRCPYCAGKYDVAVTGQMYIDDLRAANAEVERLKGQRDELREAADDYRALIANAYPVDSFGKRARALERLTKALEAAR